MTVVQAPIHAVSHQRSRIDFYRSMGDWQDFLADMRSKYAVNLAAITPDYEQEERDSLLHTATWSVVDPGNVLGQTAVAKEMDLGDVALEDVKAPVASSFSMEVTHQGPVTGLAGFFDTAFRGSKGNPVETEVYSFPACLGAAPH